MSRVVKAFLAIAVAIIFPSFVYLAVVTFLPDHAQSDLQTPKYPTSPTCYRGDNSSGYKSYSSSQNQDCQKQWDDYDRQKLDYDESMNSYNSGLRDLQNTSNTRTQQRSELAIVFGILGLILIYFVRDITALVIGFTVSSTSILVVATGYLSSNNDGVRNPLASGLSLAALVSIIAMVWLIDKMLYPAPKKHFLAPTPEAPQSEKPESK